MNTVEIKIRSVPEDVAKQLTEQAMKKGLSREEYLRRQLIGLVMVGDLKEVEERYSAMVHMAASSIQIFSKEIADLKDTLGLITEILAEGVEDGYSDSRT